MMVKALQVVIWGYKQIQGGNEFTNIGICEKWGLIVHQAVMIRHITILNINI